MTDMIERVAKAMFVASGGNPENYIHLDPNVWHQHARAAITAMREPTEEMAQTVASAYTAGVANPKMITKIYSAVVDAALECSTKPDGK